MVEKKGEWRRIEKQPGTRPGCLCRHVVIDELTT